MSLATRCPICEALFRVTPDQLRLRAGQVRCGRCNAVFDGLAHLAPELGHVAPHAEEEPAVETDSTLSEIEALDFRYDSQRAPQDPEEAAPELQTGEPAPVRRHWKEEWPIVGAAVLLAALLAGQFAFRQRDERAAESPALRPVFAAMCAALGCELTLPKRAERLSIEGDEMIAPDPKEPSRVTLIATLRNGAPFAVAYPHLELSLQNEREQVLARRILGPADYLERGTDVAQGLALHGEVNLRLALDTGAVRADGYRVLVFYPRAP